MIDKINTKIVQDGINDFEAKAEELLYFLKNSHTGRNNSITSSKMKQWGNDRQLRSFIHYLRMGGHPICSYSKGYYYAETKDDVNNTIKFILDPRVLEVVEALKGSMKELPIKHREE
jgi:hypothetical protein